jgi:SHS2 domain-containing protein
LKWTKRQNSIPPELIIRKIENCQLSYRFLDHATDAIIEVTAKDLKEAFAAAARAEINLTLDQDKVEEKEEKEFSAHGKDLRYLLFSWLEEIPFVLITEGFAIKRLEFDIEEGDGYKINAKAFGEKLDVQKHNFKVEIKAPTFYDMEIRRENGVYMRFLLDL